MQKCFVVYHPQILLPSTAMEHCLLFQTLQHHRDAYGYQMVGYSLLDGAQLSGVAIAQGGSGVFISHSVPTQYSLQSWNGANLDEKAVLGHYSSLSFEDCLIGVRYWQENGLSSMHWNLTQKINTTLHLTLSTCHQKALASLCYKALANPRCRGARGFTDFEDEVATGEDSINFNSISNSDC
ncbi:hypothetical protein BDN71DRAFT_1430309 [Pleurotus eryngii]|uniref:Uncharacterized protein n=1 Tax=Pleurotus eryngii TaxID=5323 RepID=A0A9P6D7Y3_PLEER|nr:hypothetical protein BDN71DRAFT_1430309 [Pleurotus eryngii]